MGAGRWKKVAVNGVKGKAEDEKFFASIYMEIRPFFLLLASGSTDCAIISHTFS